MLNVICVKWGTKYSADDVSRLQRNVKKYLTVPHTFVCYTEDPIGLDCKVIPIDTDLEIYWNKLAMFQKDFCKGTCLYFDIDVVIQNNIDHLINYVSNDLHMIRAYWKGDLITDGSSPNYEERYDMYANSSCLLWKADCLSYIWDYFNLDPDYYMIKYKGIDRFLFHEGFNLKYFPKGLMYSRLSGVTEVFEEYSERVLNKVKTRMLPYNEIDLFYKKDALVCIFNGPTEKWMYEKFRIHYQ